MDTAKQLSWVMVRTIGLALLIYSMLPLIVTATSFSLAYSLRNHSYIITDSTEMTPTSGFNTRTQKVCDFKPNSDPGYGTIGNNCTTYACNTWQSNTGENLDIGLDHPANLHTAIDNMNNTGSPYGGYPPMSPMPGTGVYY